MYSTDHCSFSQESCTELLLPYLLILVFEEQEGRPCSSRTLLLRLLMPGSASGVDILQMRTCVKAKAIHFH